MSSFTENLYLKRYLRQLQEENLKFKQILNEMDGLPPSYPTWTSGLTLPLTNPKHIIQLGKYHGMSGMELHPDYVHIPEYVKAHEAGTAYRKTLDSKKTS